MAFGVESGAFLANSPVSEHYRVDSKALDDLLARPSLEGLQVRAVAVKKLPRTISSYTVSNTQGKVDSDRMHEVLTELEEDPRPIFRLLTELATMPTKDFSLKQRTDLLVTTFLEHPILTMDSLLQYLPSYPLVFRPPLALTAETGKEVWTRRLSVWKSTPKIVWHLVKNLVRGAAQEIPLLGLYLTSKGVLKKGKKMLSDRLPQSISLQVKSDTDRGILGMKRFKTIATYDLPEEV